MTRSGIVGLVACLVASAPCILEPAKPVHQPLRWAEERFRAVSARALRHFNETVSAEAKEVIRTLQGKIWEVHPKGDLGESLRLDGLLKRYQAIAAGRNVMMPVAGLYSATHAEWGDGELFLRPNGTGTWSGADESEERQGTWEFEDDELRIQWESQEETLSALPTFRGDALTLSWKSSGPGAFGWHVDWPKGIDLEKLLKSRGSSFR